MSVTATRSVPIAAPGARASAPLKRAPTGPAIVANDEAPPINLVTQVFAPGAISMLVHVVLLIVLGLIANPMPIVAEQSVIIASREIDSPLLDHMELQEIERGSSDFGAIQLAAAVVAGDVTSEVSDKSVGNATVDVDDPKLRNTLTRSSGGRDSATFFGAVAKGKRFVFVVDNSKSMNGRVVGKITKFERALAELLESISKLGRDKSYYIVFFNAEPMRIFDPTPAPGFVPNTKDNYEKLYNWLKQVELQLGTKGKAAMQIAIDLKPDAIYILGDGAFTDDTASALRSMNTKKVPIHTLLFGSKSSKGRDSMEQIAQENGGTFSIVD
ncbi:MAG TPA: VWA domain-containing protein [Pirellulales bacterium]|nr:VWA domain-containing protein [Pirellulales bacterium]